jgi:hypothetical protein
LSGPVREQAERRGLPRWILWSGGGLALTALLIGGFIGIVSILKNSEPFEQAMAELRSHRSVVAALGPDMEPGFMVTGSISTNNGSGLAELHIPLSGSKGHGTAYVIAKRAEGVWRLVWLEFRPGPSDPPIVLIGS